MAAQATPIQQVIRGHNGSLVFGNGEGFDGFDFIPERPQVTLDSSLKKETISTEKVEDTTYAHFKNWIDAMVADDPLMCNNDPELGAAAITNVILGAQSYRTGKAYFFDDETYTVHDADSSWAKGWEKMSKDRSKPKHIPGWKAGDSGSVLQEPEYMKLAGPWVDGKPPSGE